MTSGFLAIVGRTADITLIVFILMQLALAFRVSQTVLLHLYHRSTGLERERIALARPLPAEDALPAVLVQIPTFNEGRLVRRVLDSVVSLDWPRDRLQIQLLDDSTDASAEIARATIAEFRFRGHDVTLIQRSHRAGFKAGALRAGLACSSQPFVAVFDADYVPSPDFLRRCLRPLLDDPHLAFVQARCDFLNARENRITHAQQVILESHFAVEQPARCWAGQFLPFNGTGGVWRRAAIEAAGGWHGDTLTEDLDLSYRAQMRGWRALYLVSVAVPGELPDSLASWGMQQCRWNKGFAQTTRTSPVDLAQPVALEAEIRCGAPSRWLHFRAVGAGYIDIMVDRRAAWHGELFLDSPARCARPAARIGGRARDGAAQQQFAAAARDRFPDPKLHDNVQAHVIHDPDAPLCRGVVNSQRDRRHTRPRVGLRANTKTGSSSLLIDLAAPVVRLCRACVGDGQAGSRTSVRVPVVLLSRRHGFAFQFRALVGAVVEPLDLQAVTRPIDPHRRRERTARLH